MWEHLRRQGIKPARCTVERLMRANGWRGVSRARKVRTTAPVPAIALLIGHDLLIHRDIQAPPLPAHTCVELVRCCSALRD